LGLGLAAAALGAPPARAQVPSTDIWLAELRVAGPEIRVGNPANVTRRSGYDNQPCFLPDGRAFLYTRGDSVATEVYRYERASGRVVQVTRTLESEYSPTPFADGRDGFCAVRVESDGVQRLWRFDRDGSRPRLVLADVDSVGYFAWIDRETVALFVVGEPHTLRVVDTRTEQETVVARDIGRALYPAPGDDLSFMVRNPESEPPTYQFRTWRLGARDTQPLIDAVGGGQDAVWIGEMLVMADGAKLFVAYPSEGPVWREVADFGAYGVSGITRLAVSRDQRWIAFVAAESP
jgi:hypothetical protein